MKEFKQDKKELERKIGDLVNEFCKKYDIKIDDIRVNHYISVTSDKVDITVNVEI